MVFSRELPLGLSARCLLDLGLVFAASACARSFWGGFFASGALYGFALAFIGNGFRVCHDVSSL